MLYVAVRAARKAGDIIARAYDHRDQLQIDQKKDRDYVTDIDRKAQAAIVREILKHYPKHGIIAEESDEINMGAPTRWYIDPLDGTTNFIHGYPHFSVSIAVWRGNKPILAVVHDPMRNETFEAQDGGGAFLNRQRLRVSNCNTMSKTLFASGLPPYRREQLDSFIGKMSASLRVCDGYRRGGSAALDLAYVACGRLDAYWESGLKSWDIAAGIILVQEAGGMATDQEGSTVDLSRGNILATNVHLHKEFIKLLTLEG
ncbi:MAG: inositol monophosphatase family protein [Mariprofundaceae bacterium]